MLGWLSEVGCVGFVGFCCLNWDVWDFWDFEEDREVGDLWICGLHLFLMKVSKGFMRPLFKLNFKSAAFVVFLKK